MMLYLPGRKNLLLIVQTKNNYFLACFCEAGLEDKIFDSSKKGFIMSLTNKVALGLNYDNPSTRAVVF